MSILENAVRAQEAIDVNKIKAKVRATLFGHPKWENACTGCGKQLILLDGDTCFQCTAFRGFAAFKSTAVKCADAMRAFGKAYENVAVREYLRKNSRLPGSTRTKRLRKKRRLTTLAWMEKQMDLSHIN